VRKPRIQLIIPLIIAWLVTPFTTAAQSTDATVVRAVLFYSPTCGHCHYVITEVLMPMVDDYGDDRLQIIGIDTSQPDGSQLYQAVIERYQISPDRQGVPTLVVGDMILVGSAEIPEVFPDTVKEALDKDGIDWPDIPGLNQVIPPEVQAESSPTPGPQPTDTSAPTPTAKPTATVGANPTLVPIPTLAPPLVATPPAVTLVDQEIPLGETQEPSPDPVGFALASTVLAGMLVAITYSARRMITARHHLFQLDRHFSAHNPKWAIPVLALLGLGVATYLAYVEIGHVQAVCGPVGECNIVQSSPYARIWGIPVAVLGVFNYLAVGVLWITRGYPGQRQAGLPAWGLMGLTLFGVLFSIYLTWLELFVIRAVCAWCLTSAVITLLLMLLAVIPITGTKKQQSSG
jgi:uncharacterized membrane protein